MLEATVLAGVTKAKQQTKEEKEADTTLKAKTNRKVLANDKYDD